MAERSHPFRVVCRNEDVTVGSTLTFTDGAEGIVTSIRSVKFLTSTTIEVIGRAKPKEKTE
ncbi:hypothetical protein [Bacillus thuringiensis]|uniref:hypothetical protein n=1 Tax=Bacillus thuringiensis TaxID=1428 RepID=UPI000BFCAADB|nr:hypothetical protein [Bacillus thuringiensis]PGT90153.1 hypothetical protein COD17_08595 [Bacillus thuringiensis]